MQSIADKKRAGQGDADSDYLFANVLQRSGFGGRPMVVCFATRNRRPGNGRESWRARRTGSRAQARDDQENNDVPLTRFLHDVMVCAKKIYGFS